MKASVIVLTWNGVPHLADCLGALAVQDYPDFEIIAVDNASTDGSADWVAEHYPAVRLIQNQSNLGFPGGNNVGLRAADGDVLVLLNQDTIVDPHWLSALVGVLQDEPGVGIVGAKALYPDGVTLQHAGGFVNERGEGEHFGYRQADDGRFNELRDVDYVTGASLAISRRALDAIGLLDEGFDLAYHEDMDWCYRARKAGYRVVYAPQAILIHKEASTGAPTCYASMVRCQYNRLRFVLKHWPCARLEREFAVSERCWLESLGEGAEEMIAAVQQAYYRHLVHLGDLAQWRSAPDCVEATEVAAGMLLALRAVHPLGPARIRPGSTTAQVTEPEPATSGPEAAPPATDGRGALPDASVSVPAPTATADVPVDVLENLMRLAAIDDAPPQGPKVPVIGSVFGALRRLWRFLTTDWYAWPVIQRQRQFNENAVLEMERLNARAEALTAGADALATRLAAVEAGIGRVTELAQQTDGLRTELAQEGYDRVRLGQVLSEYLSEDGRELADLAYELQRLRDHLKSTDRGA